MSALNNAAESYKAQSDAVHAALAELKQLIGRHNPAPTTVTWAHVGDLTHVAAGLRELVSFMRGAR